MTILKTEVTPADRAKLWRAGRLFFLLHAGQLKVYKKYHAWSRASAEARKRGEALDGLLPRCFVLDCGRRWGKDFLSLVLAVEKCLRKSKQRITYATAYRSDLNEFVLPIMDRILEDGGCPSDVKPVYKTSYQGTSHGFYFKNGSVLRLVGIDQRPNSLRGQASNGFFFTECGFIDKLEECLVRVVIPMFQGDIDADILLNSTPPTKPGHYWDTHVCPDAQTRDAYVLQTIMDNPMLTQSMRDEFIRQAGGPDAENNLRENFCVRIRSATGTVVPEFTEDKHVVDVELPAHFYGITCIDPGVKDICAVSVGYYDFDRAKLVIRRSWGERNANTATIVQAVKDLEEQTFKDTYFWSDKKFKKNPFKRVSDHEALLIKDMNSTYGMAIENVDKSGGKEAMLQGLRVAVQREQIEWHPDAKQAIEHVKNAVWNKERTDWARSEIYGHFDQLAVAQYMWRMADKVNNPYPPKGVVMQQNYSAEHLHMPKDAERRRRALPQKLSDLFGKRRFSTRGR